MAHVMSVETGDYLRAQSLVAQLAHANAERFRSEATVDDGGVWAVDVTALDVTPTLLKAVLREVHRWVNDDRELESIVVHVEGRQHTISL